ncbi:hypothetical protein K2X92_01110, partial [Candidatus Gracilibacteria bacterium]|nr:hypothetical protein [Candidatus Gracilibacteria bacterium]
MLKQKSLVVSLSLVSSLAFAGNPYRASDPVMSTIENFPSTVWQLATTAALGNVYILKADVRATNVPWDPSLVHEKLGYIFSSNTVPGKRNILGTNYARVDEPGAGARNQCVALGKAMTGAATTGNWEKGMALTA